MTTTTDEVEVKERPIIFSGPMVRAILDGRKTQTRRIIRGHTPDFLLSGYAKDSNCAYWKYPNGNRGYNQCPYGKIGDRLWIRETFSPAADGNGRMTQNEPPIYRADDPEAGGPDRQWQWVTAIYMPRWASRARLRITNVEVERLQDISCADVMAEGSPVPLREHSNSELGIQCVSAKEWFSEGWDKLNAKRGYSWESNPWVWAITFRKL